MINCPVLFLIFNRPETTRKVFNAIREAKPKQLYIAADGPRPEKPGEKETIEEVREIALAVDWDCEVQTLFRKENLGCGIGPAQAISWFFEHVEQGIILEDDCVPNQSFFYYCELLLQQYKNDPSVMHISGNNFSFQKNNSNQTYFFNYYFTAWGWATWRRAWVKYNFYVPELDEFYRLKKLENISLNKNHYKFWVETFEFVRDGKRKDVWDFQWILACWMNNAYAITPSVNLVTNIGFDQNATHTIGDSRVSYVPTAEIGALIHPVKKVRNKKLDSLIFKNYFKPPQYINHIRNFLYKVFPLKLILPLRFLRRSIFPNIK